MFVIESRLGKPFACRFLARTEFRGEVTSWGKKGFCDFTHVFWSGTVARSNRKKPASFQTPPAFTQQPFVRRARPDSHQPHPVTPHPREESPTAEPPTRDPISSKKQQPGGISRTGKLAGRSCAAKGVPSEGVRKKRRPVFRPFRGGDGGVVGCRLGQKGPAGKLNGLQQRTAFRGPAFEEPRGFALGDCGGPGQSRGGDPSGSHWREFCVGD